MLFGRHYALTAATTVAVILCCGCSRLSPGALAPVALTGIEVTSLVPILVATKRQPSTADIGEMFTAEPADEVSYASVTVSIPPDAARKIGEVQWPAALPGDPKQSFVTTSASYLDPKSFAAALSSAVKQTERGNVLVFIHGFNNRFDEALFQFAQVIHDSRSPAVPILFSWPSRGMVGMRAYQDDLQNAAGSVGAVGQLLDGIAATASVKDVTVICHSMGCVLTLEALWSRAMRDGKIGDKVKNVFLVAPDVDVNVFRSRMRQMGSSRPRFALFMSQDDRALKLSKSIWGGITRLGDVDPGQEPYRTDFQREHIAVFDLTNLSGRAHSRAFAEITSVMGLIAQWRAEGQEMVGSKPEAVSQ
jgi:esterase/lipase superfamily enzyme